MPFSVSSPKNAPEFPTVMWGDIQATFLPDGVPAPFEASATATLVFAIKNEKFLLANIAGRGWCTLGGHIETGESVEEALRREAMEEAGATLDALRPIGRYLFHWKESGRRALIPVFWAEPIALEAIPEGSESSGVMWASREELPALYFYWDALMEAVFDHAVAERQREGVQRNAGEKRNWD